MEVYLTAAQKAFAQHAIESGRLHREEEIVEEALALWEARERSRTGLIATLDAAGTYELPGERRLITQESMRQLAADVKRRGRERLAAAQQAQR